MRWTSCHACPVSKLDSLIQFPSQPSKKTHKKIKDMLDSCYQHLDNQGFSSSMYDTQVCAASCNCNFYWNCVVAFYPRTTQQVLITSAFQIELDVIWKASVFEERRKTEYHPPPPTRLSKKKTRPRRARERTNNTLHPYMATTAGFEPGPHRWETSALTTAPPSAPSGRIKPAQCNSWDFGLFFNV